jgi:hypothetical protein
VRTAQLLVCPDCGGTFGSLSRHANTRACNARKEVNALKARGFVPVTKQAQLGSAYADKIKRYGIEVVHAEEYNDRPGAEPRFVARTFVPEWAWLLCIAEPLLPDVREIAILAARGDEELQRAISAIAVLSTSPPTARFQVAVWVQERFA